MEIAQTFVQKNHKFSFCFQARERERYMCTLLWIQYIDLKYHRRHLRRKRKAKHAKSHHITQNKFKINIRSEQFVNVEKQSNLPSFTPKKVEQTERSVKRKKEREEWTQNLSI